MNTPRAVALQLVPGADPPQFPAYPEEHRVVLRLADPPLQEHHSVFTMYASILVAVQAGTGVLQHLVPSGPRQADQAIETLIELPEQSDLCDRSSSSARLPGPGTLGAASGSEGPGGTRPAEAVHCDGCAVSIQ